jgi:hypothetical protein
LDLTNLIFIGIQLYPYIGQAGNGKEGLAGIYIITFRNGPLGKIARAGGEISVVADGLAAFFYVVDLGFGKVKQF